MRSLAATLLPLVATACAAATPASRRPPNDGAWPLGPNRELLPVHVHLMEMAQHLQLRLEQQVYVVVFEPTPQRDSLVVAYNSQVDSRTPVLGTFELIVAAATRLDVARTELPRIETRVPACTMTKMGSSDQNPTRFCPEARSTDPPPSPIPPWHFAREPILLVSSAPINVTSRVPMSWLLVKSANPAGVTGAWAAVQLSSEYLRKAGSP